MFAQTIEVLLCLFSAAGLLPEWADVDKFGTGPGKDRPGRQRDDQAVRVSALPSVHSFISWSSCHPSSLHSLVLTYRLSFICFGISITVFIWNLNPFIRFTARITEIQDVLKELNSGKYERTMITQQSKGLDYCALCFFVLFWSILWICNIKMFQWIVN